MNLLDNITKEDAKLIKRESYSKGSTIFKEGSLCYKIGIIEKGSVKISSFTHIGKEIIYNILLKDQIFGNNLIFSCDPYYKGDVVALEDVVISFINKNDLIHFLQNNRQFLIRYLEIQSDFGKQLNTTLKLLSIPNAKERLLYFLADNNNEIEYNSITELASRLNLERETLSRTISALIKEKKIIKEERKIKVIR